MGADCSCGLVGTISYQFVGTPSLGEIMALFSTRRYARKWMRQHAKQANSQISLGRVIITNERSVF